MFDWKERSPGGSSFHWIRGLTLLLKDAPIEIILLLLERWGGTVLYSFAICTMISKDHFLFFFLFLTFYLVLGERRLPWNSVKNLPAMLETWFWCLGQEDPLEKEMATYSNILAWKIPWTEEPGRLQSMGSQRPDRTERLTLLTTVGSEQCCDSFRWTEKGPSHTFICVHSPPDSPPIQAAT